MSNMKGVMVDLEICGELLLWTSKRFAFLDGRALCLNERSLVCRRCGVEFRGTADLIEAEDFKEKWRTSGFAKLDFSITGRLARYVYALWKSRRRHWYELGRLREDSIWSAFGLAVSLALADKGMAGQS